jgi:hypothetical protein
VFPYASTIADTIQKLFKAANKSPHGPVVSHIDPPTIKVYGRTMVAESNPFQNPSTVSTERGLALLALIFSLSTTSLALHTT